MKDSYLLIALIGCVVFSFFWVFSFRNSFTSNSLEIYFPVLERGDRPYYVREEWKECKGVISLIAVGDLMMGGRALPVIKSRGLDYPFALTRSIIQSADIAVANLETPFTLSGKAFDKKFTFRVPPMYAKGVADAGFDVLTLANNHILDYGPEGLFSTIKTLDSLGIYHCGAGNNLAEAERGVVLERKGLKVGFLSYSLTYPSDFWATSKRCGTVYPSLWRFKKQILSLKKHIDLLVVSFHWGGELMSHPKPYQRFYAHKAVELGTDLVIGHHPHVLQGIEIYKNRLIAYSLGNYVFGSYSRSSKESIILKIYFDSKGFLLAEVIPIYVYNFEVHFQPWILEGKYREKVISCLNEISSDLNNGRQIVRPSGLITF